MEEKIKIWKIHCDGNWLAEPNIENVIDMLKDMYPGDHYTIECVEMTKEEFEGLPEFTGF